MIILNNFLFSSYTYAASGIINEAGKLVIEAIQDVLGTVIGILAILPKIVALAIGAAINALTAAVAYSGNDGLQLPAISPFDIIFGKVALVDIDFFNIKDDGSIIMAIRAGVANWYYIMRIVASAILLVILIYVGIRMAISTIADDKALYKKMIVDWVVSLALIFLLQYIIIFTINVNKAIVNALSTFIDSNNSTSSSIEHVYANLMLLAVGIDIESIAATVIYCILVWQTLGMFISYFNRMLKLAFLIIIAPLITLTYSIDKMGDGKAQALNSWLKEFVFTILLQPFHCIIYMSMVSISFSFLIKEGNALEKILHEAIPFLDRNNNSLSYGIIAILCLMFVKEAEKIVRKIFQFQDDGSTGLDKGLIASAAVLKMSGKAGIASAKGINKAKNFIATNPDRVRNLKADAMVAASFLGKGKGSENALTGTRQERKEQALTQLEEKDSEKIIRKLDQKTKESLKKYGINSRGKYKPVNGKDNAELAKMAESIREANPSLSAGRAKARARLQLANQAKKDQKREKFKNKHPKISRARTVMKELNSLDTVKDLRKLAGKGVALGAATVVFSGGLGTGSGFVNSGMLAAGTYNAVNTINQNTSKTLAENASKNFSALNCKNSTDIQSALNKIILNQDAYKDNSDEVRELLDNLKNALKQLDGVDDNTNKRIHTKLKRAIADGNTDDIENILNMELGPQNAKNSDVVSATSALNRHENEKAILGTYNSAQSAGIGSELFISQAADSLDTMLELNGDNGQEYPQEENQNEGSEGKYTKDIEDIKKQKEENIKADQILTEQQKDLEEEFIEELEKERDKLQEEMEDHLGYGYDVIDEKEISRLQTAIEEHQKAIDEFETAKREAINYINQNAKVQDDTIMEQSQIETYINVNITGASNSKQANELKRAIELSARKIEKTQGPLSVQQSNILAIEKQINLKNNPEN